MQTEIFGVMFKEMLRPKIELVDLRRSVMTFLSACVITNSSVARALRATRLDFTLL